MKNILTRGFILLVFVFFTHAQDNRLDGIAAIIGDEIILKSELDAYTMLRLNDFNNKDSLNLSDFRNQFLNELIDGKVLLVYAKNDSMISVKDQEVDKALENHINMLLQQNNLTLDSLESEIRRQQGISLTKFKTEARKAIREQLYKQKLHQSYLYDIKITRKDVENFFNEYKDSLPDVGESVSLSKLSLELKPTESILQDSYKKINSIKNKLDNGESFEELAKKYSEGPEASIGGDLGFIEKGSLNELTFEEKAFKLSPGKVSEPFRTRLGFHIIKVVEKTDQKVHIRQIFIEIKPSENEINAVYATLDSISSACKSKKDFENAVVKYCVDKSTKSKKGYLGWNILLSLSSQLRTSIEQLKPGEITKPIKENNIVSIYRINDRKDNRKLTLEDDYKILEEKTIDIMAQKKLRDLVEKWRKDIFIEIRI
ncbi:MAG TPA: peptidylprolyl isomerase [Chitinispirillaceae bacterium]|nr:peptidylprolyl isomerase [Chitinispirillaceae bacterium]